MEDKKKERKEPKDKVLPPSSGMTYPLSRLHHHLYFMILMKKRFFSAGSGATCDKTRQSCWILLIQNAQSTCLSISIGMFKTKDVKNA